jgi:hypothetical protein
MAAGADLRSRITLEGGKELVDLFKQIAGASDKAFGDMAKAAEKPVAPINRLTAAMDASRAAMTSFGQGMATVTQQANKFGSAMGNMASSIIPRWKELLALGTVGGAAGFLKLFESATQGARDLKNAADQLGVTPGVLAQLGKAAKAAGVDFDHLVQGVTKFGISLE